MASPKLHLSRISLRWHYPNQVVGRNEYSFLSADFLSAPHFHIIYKRYYRIYKCLNQEGFMDSYFSEFIYRPNALHRQLHVLHLARQ